MANMFYEESGAVTVDWVVLTAALVGLGLATMSVVSSGVQDLSTDIDVQLTNTPIETSFRGLTGWEYASFSETTYSDWYNLIIDPEEYTEIAVISDVDDFYADATASVARFENGEISAADMEERLDMAAASLAAAQTRGIAVDVTEDDIYAATQTYLELSQ